MLSILPLILCNSQATKPRLNPPMKAIALYAKASADFTEKLQATRDLLVLAAAQYTPLTQASSLGAEDMVITHLIAEAAIPSSIFVLDTRMLHLETLGVVQKIKDRYNFTADLYQPDPAAADDFVRAYGDDAMYRSIALRKQCCNIRKMEPLERALAGKKGWITGLRREQSNARAEVPATETQEVLINGVTTTRTKINPLAQWTWGDVWHFIGQNQIPYNPLHDLFYPSIGCAPCTRAISLGEDFRSGRWWWEEESTKECGLHVAETSHTPTHATHAPNAPAEPAAFEPLHRTVSIQKIPT